MRGLAYLVVMGCLLGCQAGQSGSEAIHDLTSDVIDSGDLSPAANEGAGGVGEAAAPGEFAATPQRPPVTGDMDPTGKTVYLIRELPGGIPEVEDELAQIQEQGLKIEVEQDSAVTSPTVEAPLLQPGVRLPLRPVRR